MLDITFLQIFRLKIHIPFQYNHYKNKNHKHNPMKDYDIYQAIKEEDVSTIYEGLSNNVTCTYSSAFCSDALVIGTVLSTIHSSPLN